MKAHKSTEVGTAINTVLHHNPVLWQQMEAYRNEGVCRRFAEEHDKTLKDAQRVFLEMKRFLYIAIMCQQPCSPSRIIDEMWHTFIVHTAHYRAFCQEFNGSFIDHTPSDKPEIEGYIRTCQFIESIFGELDDGLWPDPSLKVAGTRMTAAGECSNQGCTCNCSNNLGVSAGLNLN